MKAVSTLLLLALLAVTAYATRLHNGPLSPKKHHSHVAATSAADDEITNLPGLPAINFKQYSGYLNVDAKNNRNLFYWFVEAQSNPSTAPLVVWMNGGPGCSSLAGLFEEHGPFRPNADGASLSINPYAWNNVANVIYIESPAFVGFSYSDVASDKVVGDARTSKDLVAALQQFFIRYPQFANNPFYVSGESYGGHYVPNLAAAIIDSNNAGAPRINLQGFLVGNAWTVPELDNRGAIDFWYQHALLSEETYTGIINTCNFSYVGPLKEEATYSEFAMADEINNRLCDELTNKAFDEMGGSLLDIYNIYADVCLSSAHPAVHLMRKLAPFANGFLGALSRRITDTMEGDEAPCIDNYLSKYLNTPAVQQAIHAKPLVWSGCSDVVEYSRSDLLTPMLPVYERLLNENIRIVVFSGDIDAIVPVTGSRYWISALNLPIVEAWRPWTASNGQLGGFVTRYHNQFQFVTVRGAGHLVPAAQPVRALDLLTRFVNNQPF